MKIVVYHTSYGCDTGCCGHVIQSDDGEELFIFAHPYYTNNYRAFAEDLVREEYGAEHVADLDWNNCMIFDD